MISDILRYIIYHRASQFSRFDVQFYPDYVLQKLKPPRLVFNLQVYDNIILRIFTCSPVTL